MTQKDGELKRLRSALAVASEALDIAADWNVTYVEIVTPPEWKLATDTGEVYVRSLARKLRELSEGE